MECGCKQQTTRLLVEGEFGADPVWCAECQYNIELDELAIPNELMDELLHWGNRFGEWIDIEQNTMLENGDALHAAHNEEGTRLAKKLQLALAGVTVTFQPSNM